MGADTTSAFRTQNAAPWYLRKGQGVNSDAGRKWTYEVNVAHDGSQHMRSAYEGAIRQVIEVQM
jgi:hypothetical protein